MAHWPFSDPRNVSVFANRHIFDDQEWIAYVTHDLDDGAWQFHTSAPELAEADAVLVSLEQIVMRDPSVALLADLPLGWHAWRDSETAAWQRAKMPNA
ncbi:hypothetical protein [Paraburkholderia diazotrophica]|uniref:hypothetical protein n=1 Tax=Paraburkholderia diazotrophica TaxID=667676 RepID=UPI00316F0B65